MKKLTNKDFVYMSKLAKDNLIYLYDENNDLTELSKNTCINEHTYQLPPHMVGDTFVDNPFYTSNYKNTIKLNEFQRAILNQIYRLIFDKEYDENNNIPESRYSKQFTLNLPCGFGKTVLMTYLSLFLGLKTFVIINRKILMLQWAKYFKQSGLNVVCSEHGVKGLEKRNDIDVLIFPDKHLFNVEFCDYLKTNYSICIIDESHIYNLKKNNMLTKFLSYNTFQYILSLSATPRDYNELFFKNKIQLSESLKIKLEEKKQLERKLYIINKYPRIKPDLSIEQKKFIDNINNTRLLYKATYLNRLLESDEERNKLVIKNIIMRFKDNSRVVVLTSFKSHRDSIYNKLVNKLDDDIFVLLGEGKSLRDNIDKLKESEQYIIVATNDQLSTGFDMSNLNTVHIVSTLKNTKEAEQTAGRLERMFTNKNINILDYKRYIYTYNYISYDDLSVTTYFNRKLLSIYGNKSLNNWENCLLTYT